MLMVLAKEQNSHMRVFMCCALEVPQPKRHSISSTCASFMRDELCLDPSVWHIRYLSHPCSNLRMEDSNKICCAQSPGPKNDVPCVFLLVEYNAPEACSCPFPRSSARLPIYLGDRTGERYVPVFTISP